MNRKLIEWYRKYLLGERRCPKCTNWMRNTSVDMLKPWQDEYYCEKCKKYFYM